MRALFLALSLALVGCDSATVHENIIDYFVCSHMPWWMGDCQSAETRDRVELALTHGLVDASLACRTDESVLVYNGGANVENIPAVALLQITRFFDGSSIVAAMPSDVGEPESRPLAHNPQVGGYSAFFQRGENAEYTQLMRSMGSGVEFKSQVADGVWTITLDGPGASPEAYDSPQITFAGEISEYCTGFNLEAFGVTP